MTVAVQQSVVLGLIPVAYILVGLWMLVRKGWPVRAGLTTLIIALSPVAWLLALPIEETEAPGTGLLLLILLIPVLLSAFVTLIGLLLAGFRLLRRRKRARELQVG